MFCIDWSLINDRLITLIACGMSRSKVGVFVPVELSRRMYSERACDVPVTVTGRSVAEGASVIDAFAKALSSAVLVVSRTESAVGVVGD